MPNLEIQIRPLMQIEAALALKATRIAKDQWEVSELLWEAREHFDDDKSFKSWVAEKSGYTFSTAHRYIETYNRFKDNKAVSIDQKSENPIPFTKLQELSAQKVGHRTVDKVVKQLKSNKPLTVAQIRKTVREAQPEFRPPAIVYSKTFAERVAPIIGKDFSWKPAQLLDIHDHASAETVRIVARYWKGQYHPDKGGDPDIFNRIVKAEKILLGMRGEK